MESPSNIDRISMRSIASSILAVFNFEKGLTFTIKNLFLQPAKTMQNYLFSSERIRHIKPINFLILTTTVATFLTIKLLVGETNVVSISAFDFSENNSEKLAESLTLFGQLITKYYHLFQLLKVPFIALSTYWIFRKKSLNYAEHLIINSYIIGLLTCIYIFTFPIIFISMQVFGIIAVCTIFYNFFLNMIIFDEMTLKGFIKSIASYLLATVMQAIVTIIGIGLIFLYI